LQLSKINTVANPKDSDLLKCPPTLKDKQQSII